MSLRARLLAALRGCALREWQAVGFTPDGPVHVFVDSGVDGYAPPTVRILARLVDDYGCAFIGVVWGVARPDGSLDEEAVVIDYYEREVAEAIGDLAPIVDPITGR